MPISAPKAMMTKADIAMILSILDSVSNQRPISPLDRLEAERIGTLIKSQVLA